MALRLFLDSADPKAWQQWLASGLFHGVTTNPTLLRRAAQPCTLDSLAALSRTALAHGIAELHLQAWGATTADMLRCGQELAALAPGRIAVKLPVTKQGAAVARELVGAGIAVTFTACYEPHQVLIAAALGVAYIAPYLGRIQDQGRNGLAEVVTMQRCLAGLGSSVRLLVASLRQPSELSHLAAEGLNTFTISPALATELFGSEATTAASVQFESDARS
ncbi:MULTISPECIES: transaldolase family protein [Cyanobium]|uniref:Transaldolase n=1 Tax=Cyanobium usitatum str. Tous TaxID=2116684 RepID=A0A2P7MYM3_9CYAN|nr:MULTISPECIES: transaldolase family protein [Cyanobium]MCP9780031.1 transaldolase [Cyanobium sp. To12R1]PSJ06287.1 transaldolase [Cyanobium usitatum str. Tous]